MNLQRYTNVLICLTDIKIVHFIKSTTIGGFFYMTNNDTRLSVYSQDLGETVAIRDLNASVYSQDLDVSI